MTSFARVRYLLGHRVAKNATAGFIVQISAFVAPLLVVPYLSRVLSTEHYGLIAFSTTFNFYFITLVEYGFNLTATRRIAVHSDNPEMVARITWSVYAAKALLTLIGFVILVTASLSVPKFRPHVPLLCIGYLAVLGDLLFPIWLFQGLQKMQKLIWRDLTSKLLSLTLIFLFVRTDRDYLLAAGFQAGATVIAGLIGLGTVPLVLQHRWVPPSWEEARMALREGWPVFLSMVSFTITSTTGVLFLELKGGPQDVAHFVVAYRLVVALRGLVDPLKAALYPHISRMAARSKTQAIRFLDKYGLVLTLPFLFGSLSLLFAAPWMIRIFGGPKYSASIPVLQVLALSPFLLACQQNYSTLFMLTFGYEKRWSRFVLQSTLLHFALLIPSIFSMQPPLAVAFTMMFVDAFMLTRTYLFYRRHSRLLTADFVPV